MNIPCILRQDYARAYWNQCNNQEGGTNKVEAYGIVVMLIQIDGNCGSFGELEVDAVSSKCLTRLIEE